DVVGDEDAVLRRIVTGRGDERLRELAALIAAEVDRDGALAPVEGAPVDRPPLRGDGPAVDVRAPLERIDLDDLRTHLAERQAGGRRGDEGVVLDDGAAGERSRHAQASTRSKIAARPWPPPMHIVARPWRAPRRSISRARVVRMRTPVAPTGWPSEMPEPCTFVRSKSDSPKPHSRVTASACAAKASLSSMRSRSLIPRPARSSATSVAGTG